MRGSDPETDFAIERMPLMREFLQQGLKESFDFNTSLQSMAMVLSPNPQGGESTAASVKAQ